MVGSHHPTPSEVRATAPGKVILSGEHAVVYGRPALVMAVNRRAECAVTARPEKGLTFTLHDVPLSQSCPFEALREVGERLTERYERFLAGDLNVRAITENPLEPFQFAVDLLTHRLFLKPRDGLAISVRSGIPPGCGMGSSAASALSVLGAVGAFFGVEADRGRLYEYAVEVEKLHHGRPSGVDPYICLHGGFIRFRQGRAEKALQLPRARMFLVQSGAPASTTGECVMHVARHFESSTIWDDFENVGQTIEQALAENEVDALREGVRENHRLLTALQVVPERVQAFIRDVEQAGAAGKVCGAGSLAGDGGGVVLVVADHAPDALCSRYGYTCMDLEGVNEGVQIDG